MYTLVYHRRQWVTILCYWNWKSSLSQKVFNVALTPDFRYRLIYCWTEFCLSVLSKLHQQLPPQHIMKFFGGWFFIDTQHKLEEVKHPIHTAMWIWAKRRKLKEPKEMLRCVLKWNEIEKLLGGCLVKSGELILSNIYNHRSCFDNVSSPWSNFLKYQLSQSHLFLHYTK